MINIHQKSKLLWSIVLAISLTTAHTASAQNRLDLYIQEGLESNQSIKQQNFMLEKNIYALSEAKSMFLPDIVFSTTYTRTDGGRTIDIPIGDMMNDVYSTLNQLTGSNSFPQLQNQHVLINPDNFYDAKFRITQPILNVELNYNKKIKTKQIDLQKTEILFHSVLNNLDRLS